MEKPFLPHVIFGNGKSLITVGKNGQWQRFFWPTIGGPQHLSDFLLGIHTSRQHETSWIHDRHWHHTQEYAGETPVLRTVATNSYLRLRVVVTDFVHPDYDVTVRSLEITGDEQQDITVIVYSRFLLCGADFHQGVFYDRGGEALVHYRYDYCLAVGGDRPVTGYECGGNSFAAACRGELGGNEIAMDARGALAFRLGSLMPGDSLRFSLYVVPHRDIEAALRKLERCRENGAELLYETTISFWRGFLDGCRELAGEGREFRDLYRRSLVVLALLSDRQHGGILAAPEMDEYFRYSGGYGFCWGRDAAFIATAMDRCGMVDYARRFYHWAMKTQRSNGAWLQRYTIEGYPAPSWGLQIDEVGSILWGMMEHYRATGARDFLLRAWPTLKKGASFLLSFLDPETGLPAPSYDLWEERKGEHAYSAAAVWAGLMAAAAAARELGREEAEEWERAAVELRRRILQVYLLPEEKRYARTVKLEISREEFSREKALGEDVRALVDEKGYVYYQTWVDPTVDVSLLGLEVPFALVEEDDPAMENTVRLIEERLWHRPTGGLFRYERDHYRGGNPWVLTTLWLALYRLRRGEIEKGRELLRWAAGVANSLGLLPEQVDRETGEVAWVLPLAWSHAMFIHAVLDLEEKTAAAKEG